MVHKRFKICVYAVTDSIPGDGSEMIQTCLHASLTATDSIPGDG